MDVKKVVTWSLYDLANTSFSALFVTFFFPLYIKEVLGGNELQIGLVFGVSMFLVGIIVPFVGAFSDAVHRRLPFVVVFTILCSFFTAITGYLGLRAALVCGLVANFFYHAALTVYNAMLPEVSHTRQVGVISGIGVAFGYFGTVLSLAMTVVIFSMFGWSSPFALRLMFPATSIFFLLLSVPFFCGFDEKIKTRKWLSWNKIVASINGVLQTVQHVRRYKGMIPFLSAVYAYINAISAVVIFLFLYSRVQMGLSIQGFIVIYFLFSCAAILGSLAYGELIDKIGAKRSLSCAGLLWIIVILILLWHPTLVSFVIAGILGGIALGAVRTSMRPLLLQLSPPKHVGQFFGFMQLADKFSGVVGPILFGLLATRYSYGAGLTLMLVFFAFGVIVLQKVPKR